MARQLRFDEDARNALLRGMDAVADAVGATLGPRGKTVVLSRPMGPALITKDGVTVAHGISLPDPWENEGAKLIQEAARRTNTEAGDGTTAATILTRAIFREGLKQITAGADPQSVERGIHSAVGCVVEDLKRLARPIGQSDLREIISVATVSANGDSEMGRVIGLAIHTAGLEGNFSLDESPTVETSLKIAEGLEFDRGFIRPDFMANRDRGATVFTNCNIFLTDRRLIDTHQMSTFLQMYVSEAGKVPLLIIAEDVEGGALQVLAVNNGRSLQVCPVKTPGSGPSKKEELEDISILVNAKVFSVSTGDEVAQAKIADLGSADRVIVTGRRTTIVNGHGSPARIEARKEELRSRLAEPDLKDFQKALLEKRLAALSASVAVIRIGSSVQSKLLEKRDRAEDSLNATLAALREGIVPGGGVALIRCMPALEKHIEGMQGDEKTGAKIVLHALTAPLHQLATNAGQSGDVVVERVRAGRRNLPTYGYNAADGTYGDLVAKGVIDPVKVIRLAIQNAAELSGLLLTAAALVVDLPEPQKGQHA